MCERAVFHSRLPFVILTPYSCAFLTSFFQRYIKDFEWEKKEEEGEKNIIVTITLSDVLTNNPMAIKRVGIYTTTEEKKMMMMMRVGREKKKKKCVKRKWSERVMHALSSGRPGPGEMVRGG